MGSLLRRAALAPSPAVRQRWSRKSSTGSASPADRGGRGDGPVLAGSLPLWASPPTEQLQNDLIDHITSVEIERQRRDGVGDDGNFRPSALGVTAFVAGNSAAATIAGLQSGPAQPISCGGGKRDMSKRVRR